MPTQDERSQRAGRHFKEPKTNPEPAGSSREKNPDVSGDVRDTATPPAPSEPAAADPAGAAQAPKKRRLALRVVGIVVLVLVLAAGGVALAVTQMISQGERALREASKPEDLETSEEAETQDEGVTVTYQGKKYRYNENIVSIVVMGYDRHESVEATGHAGQADAVMVVALDTATGQMRVIGVPRDTMVDVDENVGSAFVGQEKMQIALAFSYGDGYDTSAQNVVRAVSRVLYNMPMNYYFAIDMQGVGPLNDAVGGVSLTPLATIPNTGVVAGQPTTLWGTAALRYVQYRDTSQLTSSLDRQARQSQYLQAFFSQAIAAAKGNPTVLVGLYQTALAYATTNLDLNEFSYLAATLVEHGMSQLDVTTLAGEAVKGGQYVEYHLDQQSVYETVLSVYYTPVPEEDPAQE